MNNTYEMNFFGNVIVLLGFAKFMLDLYRYFYMANTNPTDLMIAASIILLGYALQHEGFQFGFQTA